MLLISYTMAQVKGIVQFQIWSSYLQIQFLKTLRVRKLVKVFSIKFPGGRDVFLNYLD